MIRLDTPVIQGTKAGATAPVPHAAHLAAGLEFALVVAADASLTEAGIGAKAVGTGPVKASDAASGLAVDAGRKGGLGLAIGEGFHAADRGGDAPVNGTLSVVVLGLGKDQAGIALRSPDGLATNLGQNPKWDAAAGLSKVEFADHLMGEAANFPVLDPKVVEVAERRKETRNDSVQDAPLPPQGKAHQTYAATLPDAALAYLVVNAAAQPAPMGALSDGFVAAPEEARVSLDQGSKAGEDADNLTQTHDFATEKGGFPYAAPVPGVRPVAAFAMDEVVVPKAAALGEASRTGESANTAMRSPGVTAKADGWPALATVPIGPGQWAKSETGDAAVGRATGDPLEKVLRVASEPAAFPALDHQAKAQGIGDAGQRALPGRHTSNGPVDIPLRPSADGWVPVGFKITGNGGVAGAVARVLEATPPEPEHAQAPPHREVEGFDPAKVRAVPIDTAGSEWATLPVNHPLNSAAGRRERLHDTAMPPRTPLPGPVMPNPNGPEDFGPRVSTGVVEPQGGLQRHWAQVPQSKADDAAAKLEKLPALGQVRDVLPKTPSGAGAVAVAPKSARGGADTGQGMPLRAVLGAGPVSHRLEMGRPEPDLKAPLEYPQASRKDTAPDGKDAWVTGKVVRPFADVGEATVAQSPVKSRGPDRPMPGARVTDRLKPDLPMPDPAMPDLPRDVAIDSGMPSDRLAGIKPQSPDFNRPVSGSTIEGRAPGQLDGSAKVSVTGVAPDSPARVTEPSTPPPMSDFWKFDWAQVQGLAAPALTPIAPMPPRPPHQTERAAPVSLRASQVASPVLTGAQALADRPMTVAHASPNAATANNAPRQVPDPGVFAPNAALASIPVPTQTHPIVPAPTAVDVAPAAHALHGLPKGLAPTLIHAATHPADGRAEVTLDPVELGKVRFALTQIGDQLQVTLTVQRPETLDLLRRHAEDLRQEFREAGFASSTFTFNHWGQQDRPRDQAPDSADISPDPSPQNETPAQARRSTGSGLDLRL